nr:MAG TPA: hypothetical protein [Caudoviricetes sp.]
MAKKTRLKGLKQKKNGGLYSDFIPFGTDGKYIDMLDGLDLEQQLKLGTISQVTFGTEHSGLIDGATFENITVITQDFCSEIDVDWTIHYQVVTKIFDYSHNDTGIQQLLYKCGEGRPKELIKTKNIRITYPLGATGDDFPSIKESFA